MSDIDQTSDDRITGAAVVDGVLILRRYDGSRLEVPAGSGFNDGQTLLLQSYLNTLAPDGGGDLIPIVTNVITDANGNDISTPESITADGKAIGDDFVISSDAGNDKLWFRKPGVYVGQGRGTSTSDGEWLVYLNLALVNSAIDWYFRSGPDDVSNDVSTGSVVFSIGELNVVRNSENNFWEPGDTVDSGAFINTYGIQKGTGPSYIGIDFSIGRVV